jgi:hypothetical protein
MGSSLRTASRSLRRPASSKAQMVNEYIEGQQARQQLYVQDLQAAVGGKEELDGLLKWADTALSESEKTAANQALQSLNTDQAKLVLQGLQSRKAKALGVEPNLVKGRATGVSDAPKGYESTAQWIKDVRSEQYKTDPAFRAKVAAKLRVSKI